MQLVAEKQRMKDIAEQTKREKQEMIEKRLRMMEERRKVWTEVNSYTNRVVKDLLKEEREAEFETKLAQYHSKEVVDEIKLQEFLEKKKAGDSYLRESLANQYRVNSGRHQDSHHSASRMPDHDDFGYESDPVPDVD